MADPKEKEVKDLVKDLRLAAGDPNNQDWGRAVFLIGAGCSYSAGIPLAGGIAQGCLTKLANLYSAGQFQTEDPLVALKWLHDKGMVDAGWYSDDPSWGGLYGKIFEEHFKSDPQQREIILEAIGKSRDKINWAHLCLGELVRRGYIHTVLTTNFDQLVLQGIISTGLLPVVADGLESLTRVSSRPNKPQVVHLHGSMHTYSPRNSMTSVNETEQELSMVGMLYNLLKDSTMLVVVGYGGGEEGVMRLLIDAARHFNNMVVYWAMREPSHTLLSDRAKQLLSLGHNKFVIPNCDADAFFAEITEQLGIGAPDWMENPTGTLVVQSESFAPTNNSDIEIKIKSYQEKIQHLHRSWEEAAEHKPTDSLDRIATLRLEGRYVEALELIRQIREDNYDVWRLRAESAYEAGQQESDTNLLRESIESWQQAIGSVHKEDNPTRWYETQIGLAKALQFLYELEPEKQFIEGAIAAYRSALEVEDFKKIPLDWASAQNNLGIALLNLNETEDNPAYIQEAVAAHTAALSVLTRDKTPESWAESQSNLGGALQMLGELKEDVPILEEAVKAYHAALQEYTRKKFPLDWAETQFNLGGVLQKLGELKSDISILDASASAFRAALEEYTRDETGVNWAEAQNNLGDVLQLLADRRGESALLTQATTAYQKALEFYLESDEQDLARSVEEKILEVHKKSEKMEKSGRRGKTRK
jgi:tetratricopeptide (TPR) repeat protein/NAD-dependent SIR2 family protein deacetylase